MADHGIHDHEYRIPTTLGTIVRHDWQKVCLLTGAYDFRIDQPLVWLVELYGIIHCRKSSVWYWCWRHDVHGSGVRQRLGQD